MGTAGARASAALFWTFCVAVGASGALDVTEASGAPSPCNCSGTWVYVKEELWSLFRQDFDLAGLLDCLAAPGCAVPPEHGVPSALLSGEQAGCSEEELPGVDARVCPAGMMHYMLLCMLQMWLRRKFRQSALYFENSLGYLALVLDCLEDSDWPLWPGQVLRNYRAFLAAAFPPGKLRTEVRTNTEASADDPIEYVVAGPDVDPATFRWHSGPREGLYCPPSPGVGGSGDDDDLPGRGEVPPSPVGPPPSVLCAVPVVWPGEEEKVAAIADTFGGDCTKLIFFIAAADDAASQRASTGLRRLLPTAAVVDLAARWPYMVRDSEAALHGKTKSERSSANQKDLLIFAYIAAEESSLDWICRVETDAYFATSNFQRFVAGRGLDPADPWFLGSVSYWHMHFEPRIIFNEQVQCLSRAAVLQLAERVEAAPLVERATYSRCELSPGHRGDLMLAICLAEAGVMPSPDIADRWGREYFLNYRMEDLAHYAPDLAYGPAASDIRNFDTLAAMHWRGKAYAFMPCLGRNSFWASPFPISFHDYKDPKGLRVVHEVLSGRQECTRCPAGYRPRLADPPRPVQIPLLW